MAVDVVVLRVLSARVHEYRWRVSTPTSSLSARVRKCRWRVSTSSTSSGACRRLHRWGNPSHEKKRHPQRRRHRNGLAIGPDPALTALRIRVLGAGEAVVVVPINPNQREMLKITTGYAPASWVVGAPPPRPISTISSLSSCRRRPDSRGLSLETLPSRCVTSFTVAEVCQVRFSISDCAFAKSIRK